MTIFDQEERFSEREPSGPSEMYVLPSALDTRTTKIVDSWANVETPRLDHRLIVQPNGLLGKGEVALSADAAALSLPDVSKTKKQPPTYSFPRLARFSKHGGAEPGKGQEGPGAIYNLPGDMGVEGKSPGQIRSGFDKVT